MGAVVGVLQVVLFLAVWKIAHVSFWNMRKMMNSGSLLLTMLITLLIAILGVVFVRVANDDWVRLIGFAALLGVAGGEYEYNRTLSAR